MLLNPTGPSALMLRKLYRGGAELRMELLTHLVETTARRLFTHHGNIHQCFAVPIWGCNPLMQKRRAAGFIPRE